MEKLVNQIIKEAKKIKVIRDRYLKFPDGTITSLSRNDYVLVDNGKELAKINKNYRGINVDIDNRYDKRFKDFDALAKWLTKNKFKYVGID